jgi:tripartite-type tricarboxylate transporter receptor subunit TctC
MLFARSVLSLATALLATTVVAQAWPTKPVRIVVPFPPGGTTDQIARFVQPHLTTSLGQPVVVENRVGAAGSIGAAQVVKASPDGYDFLLAFDTHGVNPSLIPNLPFDTLKDLAPVMLIGTGPMLVTVHASTPYQNFGELLAAARAKAGFITYGTIGSGSLAHLAMTQLGGQVKADWTHVPYKGGGPLAADAAAGHVPVAVATVLLLSPHVQSGKLRALAVTSPKRTTQFPNVPTIAESGAPGFAAEAWWMLLAPAKTPTAVIDRMNREFAAALKQPTVGERLVQQGLVLTMEGPAAASAFLAREVERWGQVVRANNIKAGE